MRQGVTQKPKSKRANWYSARRRPADIKHAPAIIEGRVRFRYAYCKEFSAVSSNIAREGDRVDCKCCLRHLRKKPQYANYLMGQGIDCRGTVWTDAQGAEHWQGT